VVSFQGGYCQQHFFMGGSRVWESNHRRHGDCLRSLAASPPYSTETEIKAKVAAGEVVRYEHVCPMLGPPILAMDSED
jgi:hypothetical protein